MDEVVSKVDLFSTSVKLRVIDKLHTSLVVHADRSQRRENRRRIGVLRKLPWHLRIIVMFSYICRMEIDIVSFDFAEELLHPCDLFKGHGNGNVLRLGRGQGNNVPFLSFPLDRTSAGNDDEAAGRPALVSVSFPTLDFYSVHLLASAGSIGRGGSVAASIGVQVPLLSHMPKCSMIFIIYLVWFRYIVRGSPVQLVVPTLVLLGFPKIDHPVFRRERFLEGALGGAKVPEDQNVVHIDYYN